MKLDRYREFYHESHGEQIRVRIDPGSGDLDPLLICSGFGFSFDLLNPVLKSFPDRTVIRFDAPGVGGTFRFFPLYRFKKLAAILDDLIDSLGFEQIDVYGISWGGMLAQEFALKYPLRCRKLILASTLPGMVSVPGNMLVRGFLRPKRWFLGSDYSRMASCIYGGNVGLKHWIELERQFSLFHANIPGHLGQLSAIAGWTSIHRLHKLTQPVLLLFGRDDTVIPPINGKLLKKIIPDAQLIIFDCGHLFPWTKSEEVAREISRFRSQNNAPSEEESYQEEYCAEA